MKRIFRLSLGARGARRDVDSELAFHIEMRTREYIDQGMTPADARRAAEHAFGDRRAIESELRESRERLVKERHRTDVMHDIAQDIRFALRTLSTNKSYTLAAVLTLALGIGANSAIFSVINGVLLRRLPYEGGDRLYELHQPSVHQPDAGFAPLEVGDFRQQSRTLAGVVEYHSMAFNLYGRGEPRRVQTGVVSAGFFDVMGVHPALGRTFLPGEDATAAAPVLVLSHAFWKNQLGGDPSIVGQTFVMNDRVHTVIGVLPPLPGYPNDNDVYMPISSCPFRSAPMMEKDRAMKMVAIFARLKPGMSDAALASDLAAIANHEHVDYANDYPAAEGFSVMATPLREELTRRARPTFLVLLATAGLVLLIACANVANLTFARVLRRERELAVRAALGAGRGRLVRQLLTEGTLLALAGGALGLALAWGALGLLTTFAAHLTTRASEISIDGRVLAFTLAAALCTGIVLGLLPALPSRHDLVTALRDGGTSATASVRRLRLRGALIVSQVAVAFTLLIGAALMLRSLFNLERVDPGFDTENVLTMRVDLNWTKYAKPEQSRAFYLTLLDRIHQMSGVRSAGFTNQFPLNESGPSTMTFQIGGQPADKAHLPRADFHIATGEYFQTLGVPLLRGRFFGATDRLESPSVAIVNQSLAHHYWPNGDPIGARVSYDDGEHWLTVVGIVGDVRQYGLDKSAVDELYVSFEQLPFRMLGTNILVRTTGDPVALGRRIVDAVHEIDPNQPVYGIRTMADVRHDALASPRVTATLLALFAALALIITATGLAGVIAFTVGQRTHEIGIRIALGAERGDVLAMVVRQGMRLVVLGLAIGVATSFALTRLMSGILFGVGATDPLTFGGVSLVLFGVALAACLLPARKATRIDPIRALRMT